MPDDVNNKKVCPIPVGINNKKICVMPDDVNNKKICPIPVGINNKKVHEVAELWMTHRNHDDNLDSVAFWDNKIYVTAKDSHAIHVYDARNGIYLDKFGGMGDEFGRMNRPNGIAAIDSMIFVTERNNGRVQVFSIPENSSSNFTQESIMDYTSVCTFGEEVLLRPYGIFACKINGYYVIYVTDDGKFKGSENDNYRRVVVFVMNSEMDQVDPAKLGLPDEFGAGKFEKLESIYGNLCDGTLLIADEGTNELLLFSIFGKYLGKKITSEFFTEGEPEGIWFFRKNGKSYWLSAEQRVKKTTIFHVFDGDLNHVKSFSGLYTKNTDGVCIAETKNGLTLFAVNDDQAVTAFSLDFI
jgi:hypothetical protein